ncbi:MAG TPA: tyrosine-type recombinase/integrase [Candidatus Limnocylindrales bacterium]|nr:tyrosine-type recombinase/integrase [Candidatus Limnocylindrales bacterium]
MGEHGRGTRVPIEMRRKDGTIRRRIRVAVTMADGRRVWRTVRTEREADRVQSTLIEARELDLDPTRQTLADYLRSWIAGQRDAKRPRIRERTVIGYERLIEQRILPELGAVKLAHLSRRKVQAWLEAQPGSAQTVRNAHAVLRRALAGAVGDTLPLSPAAGVELPRRSEYHGRPLTAAEVRRLLVATATDRLGPLWRLAIVTGLRQGELLGLSRDSLDGRTLVVDHQLQRIGGRWVLGPTKAARTLQRIALDEATAAAIRAHLVAMAEERQPSWRYHGLMFVDEHGEPLHGARVLDEFKAACRRAGIEPRRFHDLRVTAATLLGELGVAEEVRMARLGHATKAMARHYAIDTETRDRAAVDQLAEVIDR